MKMKTVNQHQIFRLNLVVKLETVKQKQKHNKNECVFMSQTLYFVLFNFVCGIEGSDGYFWKCINREQAFKAPEYPRGRFKQWHI